MPEIEEADPRRDAGARPGRRQERDRRDPRGHGRRGGGAVRGRPLPHAHALRRAAGLQGRGHSRRARPRPAASRRSRFEIAATARTPCFKWESGVHRVQRVPATETQGRIHTSTATVAVLPEAEEVEVHIDPKDVRDRRLPLDRPRRPVREHDRLRGAHDARPDGHRRRLPGRALAAAEQGARDAHPARPAVRAGARGSRRRTVADARRSQIGSGEPLREDPHLQLPAEPHHRPPRQAHEPLAGAGAEGRRAGRVHRARCRRTGTGGSSRMRRASPCRSRPS